MKVHRGLDNLPPFSNAVLTIGSFDGVHHGHRAIINRLVEKAQEVGGESVILTFDPHPRQVVFPQDDSLRLLNTLEEKISLLEGTGLDHLVIIPFTVEFSQINPYKYVDDILVDKVSVSHLIIGYDHKFGLNREGDIDLLNIYAGRGIFTVEEIPKQDINDLHVSSTKIRNHLIAGDIEKANLLLGANYTISGNISRGSQIAGALGYPTANCQVKEKYKLIPDSGTYAATAEIDGSTYNGMLYIGKSPTLQERSEPIVEMNLFADISTSLYDQHIVIRPEKRFRGDQKFKSKKELLYNIGQDKIEVEHFFAQKSESALVKTAILNYNGKEHLQNYLISHAATDLHKVAVIDNASTDDSISYLEQAHPEVQVIPLSHNGGFTGGYNEGLADIGSQFVAIVNSDVRVTEGWLDPIIDLMEGDLTIAIVQPKIRSINDEDSFEYAGAAGGHLDTLGYPLCKGRILDHLEQDSNQYDQSSEIFWASGAAMVIRTDLFKKAGGFDNDFFAHMEEIDLCWRLKSAGYRIVSQPKSIVYHLGGGTLQYDHPKKVFLNLRNNYWMILKNKDIGSLLWNIPFRLLLDLNYALLFLLKGKINHFRAAVKGIILGVASWTSISKKRKELQFFQKRYRIGKKNTAGILQVILPISYYLLGKKKFSDYK